MSKLTDRSRRLTTLDVNDRGPEGSIITIGGDLDFDGASVIGDEVRWAAAHSDGPISIDCYNVGFVDSGGLRLLIEAQSMAICRGHGFRLIHVPANFASVLRISGLDDLMLGT